MNPDLYQELVRQINSLQKQVDGLIKPEVSRWMDWTPTITQGVAVAVNITYARYVIIGDTVHMEVLVTFTSAGTAGAVIQIGGIPTAIQSARTGLNAVIGTAIVTDAGVASYHAALVATAAASWKMLNHNSNNYVGANVAITLGNGDSISFQATYEQA